mgnify:CR=1 FL=1
MVKILPDFLVGSMYANEGRTLADLLKKEFHDSGRIERAKNRFSVLEQEWESRLSLIHI